MKGILAALALAVALPAQAEIYKCVSDANAVSYQDWPCEEGRQGVIATTTVTTLGSPAAGPMPGPGSDDTVERPSASPDDGASRRESVSE